MPNEQFSTEDEDLIAMVDFLSENWEPERRAAREQEDQEDWDFWLNAWGED